MSTVAANPPMLPEADACPGPLRAQTDGSERSRATNYPISRWYLRPAGASLAGRLAPTRIRPNHLTLLGLLLAAAAGAVLAGWPFLSPLAGALVLAAWFCDRTDGLLARQQGTASAWGAWLDGNVDELVDVGLHIAVATAAATQTAWFLLVAFLAGKYLFLHSLATESVRPDSRDRCADGMRRHWTVSIYHLPGNADVRLHLLVIALMCGWLTAELAVVACYYNLRWIARYWLVARRLGGDP